MSRIYSTLLRRNVATVFTIILLGCSEKDISANQEPFFFNYRPEEVGFNQDFIININDEASRLPNIYSLLIIKDRALIHEAYYNGATSASLLHIRSITKSISSIMLGIAIGADEISSQDEKLAIYYGDYLAEDREDMIDQVTLGNIIDMQSGFEWDEQSESLSWYTSLSDTWGYFFQKKVLTEPGTKFNYNSGSVSLLTRFIEKNQELSFQDYANEKLFRPLGIVDFSWEKDGIGNTRADAGLQLRAFDICKIGYAMMHDGKVDDMQIVPREWVGSSWQFENDLGSNYGSIENLHYNNLWWMGEYNDKQVFFGLGYGGQLLFCVPDYDLIVLTNHEFRLPGNVVSTHTISFIENVFIPIMNHLD